MATPAIRSEFFRDLYISPVEWQPARDQNKAILGPNETKNVGPYAVTFLGFDAAQAHADSDAMVGGKIQVEYEGQKVEVMPQITLVPGETDPAKAIKPQPVDLPGGKQIFLENFDPIQRKAVFRIDGLDLPVDPQTAVVTVSLKPGIILVWSGVIIGVLGGLIAMVRRTLEGRSKRGEVPPTPRARPVGLSAPGVSSSFTNEPPAK
jgi:cytochrome c-type biogenesis protein CcmF